ncbi:zinc finger CCCH-type with G patch domain-containing protein isoform X2 [Schistocerca nitens]|uniref:zinc finger CCCH-type with G patch domain-containing protein isoform X2 n=1 Tax=Schistocerca nitens TaxID=7011 RepID=UPI002118FB47|nr:zinc finger CCCH-type with G patch domain-containing protein isoform X2 [Schistocerca nitens]
MTTEYEELADSLKKYEEQLAQIQLAVATTGPLSDQDSLLILQEQMTHLIALTKENMIQLRNKSSDTVQNLSNDNSENEDWNSSSQNSSETTFNEIKEDFRSLEGLKCQAPYNHAWGSCSYHNAIISGVESMEDTNSIDAIQVRVFFTNPVSKEMAPCEQYFAGTCRFNDDCRYSHGHLVSLSDLKEYSEPDFSAVQPGVKALVKSDNSLWAHATVIALNIDGRCDVKFETNGIETTVDLQHILPLVEPEERLTATDSSDTDMPEPLWDTNMVERALSNPSASVLGEWEKHTKGIGSRLMAQMGYVTGSGLGKFGEGRIEPVEAVILPPGKSLDHCMNLREKAGDNGNIFSMERRLKKIRKRQEKQRIKQYEEDKGKIDLFSFLNTHLSGNTAKSKPGVSTVKTAAVPGTSSLKTQSARGLNVASLQIGEGIRRAERDLAHLNESLSRHSKGSVTYKTLLAKQEEKKKELMMLKTSESAVNNERSQRNDYKKMTTF